MTRVPSRAPRLALVALLGLAACSESAGGPVVSFQSPIEIESGPSLPPLVRAATPSSPILLFRPGDADQVLSLDTGSGAFTVVDAAAWRAATGEVAALDGNAGVKDQAVPEELPGAGDHLMQRQRSPSGRYEAAVTAGGRLHPQVYGIFDGHGAYATGRHRAVVWERATRRVVAGPTTVEARPTRSFSARLTWTADERFLIYQTQDERFSVVATGLEARDQRVSGEAAGTRGYGLFQLNESWTASGAPFAWRATGSDGAFLIRVDDDVYRYDAVGRALAPVLAARWDEATGPIAEPPVDPRRVHPTGSDEEPDWRRGRDLALGDARLVGERASPTLGTVALVIERGGQFALRLVFAHDLRPLRDDLPLPDPADVLWSPDGRRLLLQSRTHPDRKWYLAVADPRLPEALREASAGLVPITIAGTLFDEGARGADLRIAGPAPGGSALVFHEIGRPMVYSSFDPTSGTLTPAGPEDNRSAQPTWHPRLRLPTTEALTLDAATAQLRLLGTPIPTARAQVRSLTLLPDWRAVVTSTDDEHPDTFVHELIRIPECTRIAAPIELPLLAAATARVPGGPSPLGVTPDGHHVLYCGWSRRYLTIVPTPAR